MHVVIVGAGQGGAQLACGLRASGFDGAITLIGDEPGLPYQRPPLSKAYLADGDDQRLLLRPDGYYEDNDIIYLGGLRVTAIDPAARRISTDDGQSIAYDHLVLATGARNARPPIGNLDLPGIYAMRTRADADALRDVLGAVQHAVVIGGGFIGLEFAAVARAKGVAVTVVEGAPRLMARAVSPATSNYFLTAHQAMGASIELGRFVSEVLDQGGRAAGVRLADGAEIAGDLVLLAAGVAPNSELAEAAGLAVENGVRVNAQLLTSDPTISALGDCASFPDPASGARIRLESVQAANDHGRCIAARLTGAPRDYAEVPWFWSDQGEHKLQIAGLTGASDAQDVVEAADGFIVLCYQGERLIGVETVNAGGEHMAARRLLAGPPIHRDEVEAAGRNLRALFKARR